MDELANFPEAAEALSALRAAERELADTSRGRLRELGLDQHVEPGKPSVLALRSHLPVLIHETYPVPLRSFETLVSAFILWAHLFAAFFGAVFLFNAKMFSHSGTSELLGTGLVCWPGAAALVVAIALTRRLLARRVLLTQRTLRIDGTAYNLSDIARVESRVAPGYPDSLGYTVLELHGRDGERTRVTLGDRAGTLAAILADIVQRANTEEPRSRLGDASL